MVDDEKHTNLGKWSKRDYMREYMRERRKKARQQPAPSPRPDLHGPVAPPNLPRTGTVKALLQAHYAHVLNLWAETGKEPARVTDVDEMLNTIDSLMLENVNLRKELNAQRDEVKTLREAQKTQVLKPQEPLPPPLPTATKPLEPGLVDPDRRPSLADDTEPEW